MWDLIVSVSDHYLSFYFSTVYPHPIYPAFQNKINQSINHTPLQKYGTLRNKRRSKILVTNKLHKICFPNKFYSTLSNELLYKMIKNETHSNCYIYNYWQEQL